MTLQIGVNNENQIPVLQGGLFKFCFSMVILYGLLIGLVAAIWLGIFVDAPAPRSGWPQPKRPKYKGRKILPGEPGYADKVSVFTGGRFRRSRGNRRSRQLSRRFHR